MKVIANIVQSNRLGNIIVNKSNDICEKVVFVIACDYSVKCGKIKASEKIASVREVKHGT